MPSLQDSVVIFILALILFGPKRLPGLARQLGKLMAEFRRASNEFRMQMEDELRIEEQKEHQRKVDAMAGPPSTLPDPPHPHLPQHTDAVDDIPLAPVYGSALDEISPETTQIPAEPQPIAESGNLRMMPPSTGLPVESGARGTSRVVDAHTSDAYVTEEASSIPEHSILPPSTAGISSDEPLNDTTATEVSNEAQAHA